MAVIRKADFISSVAEGLQKISYCLSDDFVEVYTQAWVREQSDVAKNAMTQVLLNAKMALQGKRPVCQDTGMVLAFVEVGMDVQWETDMTVEEMVNEGVAIAYTGYKENVLRASVVSDPAGKRPNTRNNAPAVTHVKLVKGDKVLVRLAAKGGGSEFKARLAILNPSDNIADWVASVVPSLGGGWCPPGILGVGIGGNAEKAMELAKEALFQPVNIEELKVKGASNREEELRLEIYNKVNATGMGAQGLGGVTTVLDVKICTYPTHAATLPVAIAPNCTANRHVEFTLDGKGKAAFDEYDLTVLPYIDAEKFSEGCKRINVDTLKREEMANLKAGDRVLLTGTILTGRDAAHKRLADLLANGKPLPEGVDFRNKFIYYVGPVDPVAGEVIGPAGPTTSTRMDKFTEMMLGELGIIGMIGKGERNQATVASIKAHKAIYLVGVGGAAYLVSKAIKEARVVAFEDLGMEAIYEFVVKDMPFTVAVDGQGNSLHEMGPRTWKTTS